MERAHPSWDGIEPAVSDAAYPQNFSDWPGEHAIELSKAISLKRIADALSGEDGEGVFRQPINAYGETIGEAIQGQITRGFQQGAEWLPRSK